METRLVRFIAGITNFAGTLGRKIGHVDIRRRQELVDGPRLGPGRRHQRKPLSGPGHHGGHRSASPTQALVIVLITAVIMVTLSACDWQSLPVSTPPSLGTSPDQHPNLGSASPDTSDDHQSAFPIRAAFYYQWFPESWRQNGTYPYSVYTPSLGFYNSETVATIRSHLDAMRYGHINAAITSWWGPNQKGEQIRVPTLLTTAADTDPRFRIALYYEKEGIGDPPVSELKQDLDYILDKYGKQKNYLHVGGRPVLFVYNADDLDCSVLDRWAAADASAHFYLDFKVFPGWSSCPRQPDAWHQYAPAQPRSEVASNSAVAGAFAISPGFAHAQDTAPAGAVPHLNRDLQRWSQDIRAMVASGQSWQLVTSFNEWGEGTSVESAIQWTTPSGKGAYLDALHADGR